MNSNAAAVNSRTGSIKPMKFGILGTGMIADTHARALKTLPEAVLTGAADIRPERAEAFAGTFGIRAYPSPDAMLNDPEIDAVCICTPSGFHYENASRALAYKKHVVLEKPMALTTEDADRLIEAADASGRLLTVLAQMRFTESVRHVKKLVAEDAFGKLSMCSLYMKYWRDPSYYTASSWRGTKRFDGGGALMNQGIHGVDVLRFLCGNYRAEAAQMRTSTHKIEVEDTVNALISFDSGAIGVIEASTCAYPGFDRRLEILGNRGHVILRETEIESLVIDGKQIVSPKKDSTASDSSRIPSVADCTLHAMQIQNLIDAANGRAELVSDAHDGRAAVAVINDIYRLASK